MKNEAPARIIPIAALNPYQGRWAIKARVTAKGEIRRYNNARGDGKEVKYEPPASMPLLIASDGYSTLADAHVLPASHLSYFAGVWILDYINSTATSRLPLLVQKAISINGD
ncbi:hypothetical protein CsSME_00005273 [Camellia sinensis var. sinensis]